MNTSNLSQIALELCHLISINGGSVNQKNMPGLRSCASAAAVLAALPLVLAITPEYAENVETATRGDQLTTDQANARGSSA